MATTENDKSPGKDSGFETLLPVLSALFLSRKGLTPDMYERLRSTLSHLSKFRDVSPVVKPYFGTKPLDAIVSMSEKLPTRWSEALYEFPNIRRHPVLIRLNPEILQPNRSEILGPALLHEMAHPLVSTLSNPNKSFLSRAALEKLPRGDIERMPMYSRNPEDLIDELVTMLVERKEAKRVGFPEYQWP